jgi:UDP-N-acetylmuramoyl-L-alanyl-D-glutamate--2,6-diaminopimelate ligase
MERRLSAFFTDEIARLSGLTGRCGDADPVVTGVEYDSRKVRPGNIYFALPGLHADGHAFIDNAVAAGAAVIVHEAALGATAPGVVYLQAANSRCAMSPVSAAFYGFPSRRLIVAGVTGTEGKSTTVYLIYQLLALMGKKAGFISTVMHGDGGEPRWNPEHQTTPEAPAVQRMLYEMAENGCEYAVVEASSHGLSKRTNRLGDVEFDCAVFTNVTHEHLEFHGTWEQYRDDKANLFRALDRERHKTTAEVEPFGVINADDKSAKWFAGAAKRKTVTFSVRGKDADLAMKAIEAGAGGNWYTVFAAAENDDIDIRDRLPGAFNAGNVLAAILAVSGMTGVPASTIARLAPRLRPVRGRMTAVEQGQPFEVVVDYAHTPSSFLTIFPPLRKRFDASGGNIIALFGSAGERDTKKRSEQGTIAARYADYIILTDEDPRGETPMAILEEIAQGTDQGCEAAQGGTAFKRGENLFLIPDRPAAIRKALSLARAGDMVLLLGKGHENTIIYQDRVMPFDEIAEAEAALGEQGFTGRPRSPSDL